MCRTAKLRIGQCVVLLLGILLGWISIAGERGPVIPKGKGEQCVAETDFMRRNHMDLILHQRDDTVIRGIRDEPFSLSECVDCHVQRDSNDAPIRVDAQDQFCASCHAFVAVKVDCFGCHAAVPDSHSTDRADATQWLPGEELLTFSQRSVASFQHIEGHDRNELEKP